MRCFLTEKREDPIIGVIFTTSVVFCVACRLNLYAMHTPCCVYSAAAEAAWDDWSYELNVTSSNDFQRRLSNISELGVRVDGLQPSTAYNLSILAYK